MNRARKKLFSPSDPGKYLNPAVITVIYFTLGLLWIFFSDRLLNSVISDPAAQMQFQTVKGILYIGVTALLLYWLMKRNISRIQRSSEIVKKNEQRLNLALKGSDQGLWDWDLSANQIYFDRQWNEIIGYDWDGSRVPFSEWKEMIHPGDRDRTLKEINDHVLGKSAYYETEYRIHTKSGQWKWLWDTGKVVSFDESGKPLRMIGTHKDITSRKKTDLALKESQRKLATLMENLPGMAYRCYNDANWTMEFVSDGCYDLTGYQKEDIIFNHNISYANIIHPEDRQQVWDEVSVQLAGDKPFTLLYRIRTREGKIKWVWEKGCAVSVKNGDTRVIEGFIMDITDRIKAETALEQRNLQYESFIHNSLVGIWRIEFTEPISATLPAREIAQQIIETGYFSECNNAMAHMYKYSAKEDLVGTPIKNLVIDSKASLDRLETAVRNNFKAEIIDSEEKDREGNVHYFRNSYFGYIENGKLLWLWGIQLDITEHRQLEDQYRQAQKMEAIGNLAGGIAHEFNNLLTVINVHSDMLLDHLEDPQRLTAGLSAIKKAGERAVALTRKLLTFSRRQIVQPKPLNLNESVKDSLKLLEPLIEENIEVKTKFGDDSYIIKIDGTQFEQIIMNLVVNARDAMPNGGELIIETSRKILDEEYTRRHLDVAPGEYVLLSISDTGTGMDEETRKQIFEPFFTTKSKDKGSGLGLATVYGIVKQNGGSIWVYSEPGSGTTFNIYLPAYEGEPVKEDIHPQGTSLPEGSETILLAEDEESVRTLIVDILETYGYQVLETVSSAGALETCQGFAGEIDLLVTDVIMPGINGPELAEKCQETRNNLKVLYLSGYTENVIVNQGVLKPGVVFLQKPFTPQQLLEKIRVTLDDNSPAS